MDEPMVAWTLSPRRLLTGPGLWGPGCAAGDVPVIAGYLADFPKVLLREVGIGYGAPGTF
jgi:hypothetical protein